MTRKFYYDTGEEKIGPVTGQDLVRLLQQGEIQEDTWVRRAESSTWRQLANVDLREEQQREKARSFWSNLWASLPPGAIVGLICLLIFALAAIFLIGSLVVSFFPYIIAILVVWLLYRAIR